MVEKFLTGSGKYVAYGGSLGGGKIIQKGDFLLTPFGFKRIEDVSVGDLINHPSGGVQRVIQLKPWVKLDKWIVEFYDGTKLEVAEDHLWQAWRSKTGSGSKSRKIKGARVSGRDSAEVVETKTLKDWIDRGYTPQIPVPEPQPFNRASKEKDRIPPYLLGVLLGDGCIGEKEISISVGKEDQEHLFSYLDKQGYKYSKNKDGRSLNFRGDTLIWLRKKLTDYGLLNKRSYEKFIPERYKMAKLEDRFELIRGLIDTDGYRDKSKAGVYYYSVSKQLAEDVTWVLRSLGCVVTMWEKPGSYKDSEGIKHDCRLCYCLYIKSRDPDSLVSLERKKVGKTYPHISKRVKAVYPNGEKIVGRCITVSNPDGLYITNDFIVTHNSFVIRLLANYLAETYPGIRILIFRKTFPMLNKTHIQEMWKEYPHLRATYNKSEKIIYYPNGSQIQFDYAEHSGDVIKFQSQEFHVIFIDESTHCEDKDIEMLRSRNRGTGVAFPCKMLFTTNPGGPSHNWHKRVFVDREFKSGEDPDQFSFLEARAWDNHMWVLDALEEDGLTTVDYYQWTEEQRRLYFLSRSDYGKELNQLPEEKKVSWLDGSWEIYEGMFFESYRSEYHEVVSEFDIPKDWEIRAAIDYGRVTVMEVQAQAKDGRVFNIDECYTTDLSPSERAEVFAEFLLSRGYESIRVYYDTNMEHDVSKYHSTETTALRVFKRVFVQIMGNKAPRMIPVSKKRVQHSKFRHHCNDTLKEYLAWSADPETGELIRKPHFFIFKKRCPHLVRSLKSLVYDPNDPLGLDHADKVGEDHPKDASAYALITWKRPKFEEPDKEETPQEMAERKIREHINKSAGKKIFQT